MKRAIYLDDRERDLAHRALSTVAEWLTEHTRSRTTYLIEKMAICWTRDEIELLAARFVDPTDDTKTDKT